LSSCRARLGAGESRPLARNIRAALEEAGGMFVKLGQVLSTCADLLPADVIAELSVLQDHAAPADPAGIEALLTAELGAPPYSVFTSFDPVPLAAASIGQAHRAQLSTGELVIVKVQRPDVRALVERDLDIPAPDGPGAGGAGRVGPGVRGAGDDPRVRRRARRGTRLPHRGRNIAAVAGSSQIRVRAVYRQWSTSRVLVLEYLDGVSVRDAEPVLAKTNADRHGLACVLLAAMLRQVVAEATFHARPASGQRPGAL
jgi:ubiquinone biosynthesis protein